MTRLKALGSLVAAFFPTALPTTVEGMAKWCDEVVALAGFPVNNSFRHATLTMILHLSPNTDRKAKRYFVKALRKSAANQISYNLIQGIKIEEDEQKTTKSSTN